MSRPRVHAGSAHHVKPGWVNVDLVGHPVDVAWDLLTPLPFTDAEAVFAEHVLEHFALDEAARILRSFYDTLMPGGTVRVGVPDAGAYLRSYAGDGSFIEANRPGRATRLVAVQEVFFLHGHRSAYDAETLILVLEAAGFVHVQERRFGESSIVPAPDSSHRRPETLYVEGVKPTTASL